MQDTGKFRTNEKDQFYTRADIARRCIQSILTHVTNAEEYIWVEPSAGSGAFLQNVPEHIQKMGIDIEPAGDGIERADFLQWSPPSPCLLFGNPPFGRQSSIAKAFIAHGGKFADIIAFILPKSFTKPSMYRVFDAHFHCIFVEELEKNAFLLNGKEPYDVPCVFQIWQRREEVRPADTKVGAEGFDYVRPTDAYHIAFRRVGGLAGKCYPAGGTFSPQSHYFLRLSPQFEGHIGAIVGSVNSHVFPSNTVGPRSLSKTEINEVMNRVIASIQT